MNIPDSLGPQFYIKNLHLKRTYCSTYESRLFHLKQKYNMTHKKYKINEVGLFENGLSRQQLLIIMIKKNNNK